MLEATTILTQGGIDQEPALSG